MLNLEVGKMYRMKFKEMMINSDGGYVPYVSFVEVIGEDKETYKIRYLDDGYTSRFTKKIRGDSKIETEEITYKDYLAEVRI